MCVSEKDNRRPERLLSCWRHPFVVVPSVLGATTAVGIGFLVANYSHRTPFTPQYAGVVPIVLTAVLATAGLVFVAFVAVLWTLGHPCCRDEGPSANTNVRHTEPLVVDVIDLSLPTHPGGAVAVTMGDRSGQAGILTGGTAAGSSACCLGMCIAPGRKRKRDQRVTADDVARLREEFRMDALVTLLEPREMAVMECEDTAELVRGHGMEFVGFPMRDKWIPTDSPAFLRLVERILGLLRAGKRVAVHCNGGKGRTGTVVAAVLMTRSAASCHVVGINGVPLAADHRVRVGRCKAGGVSHAPSSQRCSSLARATRIMRRSRPGMLKNPLQRAYLGWYARPALQGL